MIMFVGLLARAGHGKSTAAKFLAEKYGAKVISLASPLKRVCKKVMNFSDDQLWGTQEQKETIDPRYGFSARTFMQRLGTEGLRQEFGDDVHLSAMIETVIKTEGPTGRALYVIDDVRFLNETRFIDRLGTFHGPQHMRGGVLKIVCTDAPALSADVAAHTSEQEIDTIPQSMIAGTAVSSRAQGPEHLLGEIQKILSTAPRFQIAHKCPSDFGLKNSF